MITDVICDYLRYLICANLRKKDENRITFSTALSI